jgi:hypothetical protein
MTSENITSSFASKAANGLIGAILGAIIGLLGWFALYSDWTSFIFDWPILEPYLDLIWQTLLDGSEGPSPSTLAIIIRYVVIGLGAISGVVRAVYEPQNPIWRIIISSLISGLVGLIFFGLEGLSYGLAGMAIGINTGLFVNLILL